MESGGRVYNIRACLAVAFGEGGRLDNEIDR